MLGVKCTRLSSSVALAAGAASLVLALTACGSDSGDTDSDTASTSRTPVEFFPSSPASNAPVAAACPAAAPTGDVEPEWTFSGDTGSVVVTGSTDTAAPVVDVTGPFSVSETQVQTLTPGDGPVVADTATVSVCYLGVNGRDGSVFDSSYQDGPPVEFPLGGVVPGFQKAIAGQKVGSTVAVAMTSADGYPEGQPAAGIQPGDSLIFAIKILDATS